VADVAGKGVPAGLIMTAARATFRSVVLEHGSPATILGRVNRILAEEDFNHRFVTAILARVDLAGSRLTVSTAAHEPLMLVRAGTDQVERIGRPALPLGVSPEATYEDITVPLGPGDRFLLYTDGVTEAMNAARVPFGPDALARLLTLPVGGAEELRRAVLRAVASHVGAAPRHDDTTLMAACVSAYPSDG
jgi:sigma-B regulation protein RsbU (phosphoserine phosphatase)